MDTLLNALIRPRTIAVIGASPNRQTLGNVALDNLANYKFAGKVIPVHGQAAEIAGLAAVTSIEALPDDVDVALASVPAASVADVVRRLDRRGVRTAIVNTAGFSPEQEAELRLLVSNSRVLMHGPNCMGLINLSDATPIYTGGITSRVRRGPVALIAQSGSAAISVINSSTAGFSKVVTIGSEYRVTGADYLRWFATDDDTSVIGLVLESIPDADRFADAVDLVHAAGKSMVILKVGRSAIGARATLAHTGALIRNDDAFKGFVARYGIPVVDDYEELIATLEAFAVSKKRPTQGHVGLMGISGGETALACDICDEIDLPLAVFSEATGAALRAGAAGHRRPKSARCRPECRPPGGRCPGRHDRDHGGGRGWHRRRPAGHAGVVAGQQPAQLHRPPGDGRGAQPQGRQADRRDFADGRNHERSAARATGGHRRAAPARIVAGAGGGEEHAALGRAQARSAPPRRSQADAGARRRCGRKWPASAARCRRS